MASAADRSFPSRVAARTALFTPDSFSHLSEVQEGSKASTLNSTIAKGKFGRSSMYSATSSTKSTHSTSGKTSCSASSKTQSTAVKTALYSATSSSSQSVKKVTTKKTRTKTSSTSGGANAAGKRIDAQAADDDRMEPSLESPSSPHQINTTDFFKTKFTNHLDGEDFFRSASTRFSMTNLKDTSGWNFDLDDGASLFPDFFPKNNAATKLSFEATWREVSPTKEFGLAKQAIKNCSWDEDEENKDEHDAKQIVNSWMQFFGPQVNSVKDGKCC